MDGLFSKSQQLVLKIGQSERIHKGRYVSRQEILPVGASEFNVHIQIRRRKCVSIVISDMNLFNEQVYISSPPYQRK